MGKDSSLLVGRNSSLPSLCHPSLVLPLWYSLLCLDYLVVVSMQVGPVDWVVSLHPVHILLVGPFV